MADLRDLLERADRAVADIEPLAPGLDELERRRERRHRNRRIRAGALGVIVTLATGFALARSIASDPVPVGPPAEPVLSGALVYALDGDIWVADPEGSDAVAITNVAADDDGCPAGRSGYGLPMWSPDGRYIAFRHSDCSQPDGERDVVITDPRGNVLANFPAQGVGVAWSPDSTRVAVWDEYSWDENGVGAFTIGIYGIDGTRERQITMPPGWEPFDQRDPVWTPDGAALLVNDLVVPVDGGTPREVPFPQAFRYSRGGWWSAPRAYSPDGSRIAYGTRHALMVARPDGTEPREVIRNAPVYAAWSPTGEMIAFTADAPEGPWAPNQLRIVDVTTGSATLLVEGRPRTWLTVIGFSLEGDRVLFREQRDLPGGSAAYSLWSIGVDGEDMHSVANSADGAWRPA